MEVFITQKNQYDRSSSIYKEGKYYLMCAEGGTGDNHSEVIFISDSVTGPFVSSKQNPILSQRHLPAKPSG